MSELSLKFSHVVLLCVALLIIGAWGPTTYAQHEGHNMPNANKPKARSKPNTTKRATVPRRRATNRRAVRSSKAKPLVRTPAPVTAPMPAHPPGHGQHQVEKAEPKSASEATPAITATPDSSPVPGHQHVPAAPSSSPAGHQHVPAAPTSPSDPKSSATPAASPEGHQHVTSQPTARPEDHTSHGAVPAAVSDSKTEPMDTGPLLVMTENDMGIRIGSSEKAFLSMGQMGSGTAWNPASTPMHMYHKQADEWLLMFHYNAIVGVNSQGGPRGVTKLESQNWFMPMAFRKLGPGTLQLRGMFSFEPFTFPPGGSPLLFQTGETCKGQPIIDAQHPHDLFMELSASYTTALGERGSWFAYVGYPGEPALGPTAFMHRASASENPSAVLSHHYQDSSHITFGVVTTGFTYRWFKLEGSLFNGREPDENRYNFDAHRWNSRSARLSFAPNRNLSMQVSHGFLRDPEALEPGDVRRTTASISYNKPSSRGNWATSLIWGRNHENHGGEIFNLNGYVAESSVNFLDKNYVYTRLELADKNQLLRAEDRARLGITDHHASFRIGALHIRRRKRCVEQQKDFDRRRWRCHALLEAHDSRFNLRTAPGVVSGLPSVPAAANEDVRS